MEGQTGEGWGLRAVFGQPSREDEAGGDKGGGDGEAYDDARGTPPDGVAAAR
jgi:hypothetical protein